MPGLNELWDGPQKGRMHKERKAEGIYFRVFTYKRMGMKSCWIQISSEIFTEIKIIQIVHRFFCTLVYNKVLNNAFIKSSTF